MFLAIFGRLLILFEVLYVFGPAEFHGALRCMSWDYVIVSRTFSSAEGPNLRRLDPSSAGSPFGDVWGSICLLENDTKDTGLCCREDDTLGGTVQDFTTMGGIPR